MHKFGKWFYVPDDWFPNARKQSLPSGVVVASHEVPPPVEAGLVAEDAEAASEPSECVRGSPVPALELRGHGGDAFLELLAADSQQLHSVRARVPYSGGSRVAAKIGRPLTGTKALHRERLLTSGLRI